MFDREIEEDRRNPTPFRPLVAIGHTKDLADLDTIESSLACLQSHGIPVSTFADVHDKITGRSERS
jgi:hypothetical protein